MKRFFTMHARMWMLLAGLVAVLLLWLTYDVTYKCLTGGAAPVKDEKAISLADNAKAEADRAKTEANRAAVEASKATDAAASAKAEADRASRATPVVTVSPIRVDPVAPPPRWNLEDLLRDFPSENKAVAELAARRLAATDGGAEALVKLFAETNSENLKARVVWTLHYWSGEPARRHILDVFLDPAKYRANLAEAGREIVKRIDELAKKSGTPGKDGKNGDPGKNGENGKNGAQGLRGEKGEPGKTPVQRCVNGYLRWVYE